MMLNRNQVAQLEQIEQSRDRQEREKRLTATQQIDLARLRRNYQEAARQAAYHSRGLDGALLNRAHYPKHHQHHVTFTAQAEFHRRQTDRLVREKAQARKKLMSFLRVHQL